MNIKGTYTFPAKPEEVWDILLDPQMLMRIVPGMQKIDVKADDEIIATVALAFGPVRGAFHGKVNLLEQKKPTHVKIVGEGIDGTVGSIKGTCIIDAVEQGGATLVSYDADVQLSGALATVGQPFIHAAANKIMQRGFKILTNAHRANASSAEAELSSLDKAAQTWDAMDIDQVRQVAWSAIQYVSQQYAHNFSKDQPSALYVHEKLAQRLNGVHAALKGAALVCGDMVAERDYFEIDQLLKFTEVDGYDISSVSLAKYHPEKIQFTPHVADCNNIILETEKYDLVVTCHGAHHVYNLGNFFFQASKSLKKDGLFYMVEWIGPEYLQIPLTNHIIASLLLLLLFDKKTRTTHMGQIKGLRVQDPPAAFEPSEACNSTELLPQFTKYFKPIRLVACAGLAYPVFEGIAQNIDQSKFSNQFKIKFVYFVEQWLTRLKIVKPLFASAIAEKRTRVF